MKQGSLEIENEMKSLLPVHSRMKSKSLDLITIIDASKN